MLISSAQYPKPASMFRDQGTNRWLWWYFALVFQVTFRMNSGRLIKLTNRFYTLSSWVSLILEVGCRITQFEEPHVEAKPIPTDAPDYVKCCRKASGDVLGGHQAIFTIVNASKYCLTAIHACISIFEMVTLLAICQSY